MSLSHIPSLDTDSYASDIKIKLRRLYNYFLIAEHRQTISYVEPPVSLNHLLELYIDDLSILRVKVEEALEIYLSKHFTSVELEINITDSDLTNAPVIKIGIEVTNNGRTTTLLESIDLSKDNAIRNGYIDSKITRI